MVVIRTWHKHTWHLEKIFKAKLPSTGQWLQGNHYCLMPEVFHRNSTQGNQLRSTLTCTPPKEILNFFFYIATPLLCMVLDSCLLLHKKSSCLPALQQPAISTYKICSFIYLA